MTDPNAKVQQSSRCDFRLLASQLYFVHVGLWLAVRAACAVRILRECAASRLQAAPFISLPLRLIVSRFDSPAHVHHVHYRRTSLEQIGSVIRNPEIKKIAPILQLALTDPAGNACKTSHPAVAFACASLHGQGC
jgi:hypothetical protein